jgi:hypothetical protein
MLPEVPEPDPSHRLAKVAVSPSAGIAAAAGAGLGVLLDPHTFVLAVVLGVGAWAARIGVGMFRGWRRRLPTVDIDPWAVPEPWRQYVRQAVDARQRFDQALAQWQPGPLRDRLVSLQPQIRRSAHEVFAVARQGAVLDGSAIGVGGGSGKRPTVEQLSTELRTVQEEERRQDATGTPDDGSLARTEAAVAAQLRAATGSRAAAAEALDRLRLLTARLDEAVTSLLSLGVVQSSSSDDPSAAVTGSSVDAVVDELTALHEGLIAASGASAGAVSPGAVSPGAVSPGAVSPGAVSPGAVSAGGSSPAPALEPGAQPSTTSGAGPNPEPPAAIPPAGIESSGGPGSPGPPSGGLPQAYKRS